jgi:hypothetical protein
MARNMTPSDYVYKRYRIARPKHLPQTTISLPFLEHLRMEHQVGGLKQMSALVRGEAERLREVGGYSGTLSAAVLRAVRAKLKATATGKEKPA